MKVLNHDTINAYPTPAAPNPNTNNPRALIVVEITT